MFRKATPLSSLLVNIMLDLLVKELEKRSHQFDGYADNFVIIMKSLRAGERMLRSISKLAEQRLKLTMSNEKSGVVKAAECKFLGFTFNRGNIQ